ncbi:30S ribosomal protein S16 [Spirilliplanes yamanashiensis]|uniref:30S ribosomal protein S16 n=1 Tax=Spirilliplanes yamanashiensis TaxID=42233 RepID=UPI001951171B|nr:30S ribosomal protein S16 [Spirilliplanes yamanashiensis]
MAVKIRLLRMGKIRNPQYRIVVADSRVKRDGRAIEYIGIYHPKEHPSVIEVKSDRVQHWLSVGAQPSEPVQRLLEKTGDWQKFKGLPAPPPLLVSEARRSQQEIYEAEAKAAAGIESATERPAKKADKADKAQDVKKAPKVTDGPAETREESALKADDPAGADARTEDVKASATEGTADAGAGDAN